MIVNRQRLVRLERRPLEVFLERVREELGLGDAGLTVCLVTDAEIARMNARFRKKKGSTDVLSFPSGEKRARNRATYLGDIAIAPRTARRYAKKNGRRLDEELRVLVLHGVLHLLGYDHETDQGQMERIEMRLRKRFGLT